MTRLLIPKPFFVFSLSLINHQLVLLLIFSLVSCQTPEQKGQQLAKVHCSSCHDYPEPALLDKKTWERSILPNMASRMGFNDPYFTVLGTKSDDQLQRIMASGAFFSEPSIDSTDWKLIVDYYLKNAPEKLSKITDSQTITPQLKYFDVEKLVLSGRNRPMVSYVGMHPKNHEIYVAESFGAIHVLNNGKEVDEIRTPSPVSDIDFSEDNIRLLEMGIMNPNDAMRGTFSSYTKNKTTPILKNLARPVHINKADLNLDGKQDLILCEHGDYTGKLAWYQNVGNGTYKEQLLNSLPGARLTVIRDWNKDGRLDVLALMGQGREGIYLYLGNGVGQFVEKPLLKFSPVHGSSYFDVVDMNKDGFEDVVYTNGDNSDLSIIQKPYHGVRIFLNDGKGNLTEKYFYALDGASKVMVEDFDADGDKDMAVISYFPDLTKNQRFLLFENQGNLKFNLSTFAEAPLGKWLVCCAEDIDADGDKDIILGSYPSPGFWEYPKDVAVLPTAIILRNKTKTLK